MDGKREVEKGLKLFGVRIVDGESRWKQEAAMEGKDEAMKKTMLKSLSMVNLAAYEGPAAGEQREGDHRYLSDGGLEQSSRRGGQEKKRGVPWTEEEHRTFLAGLEKLGKGDWRGISRNFVMTRTPTQVASHAQKYFLRKNNPNKKKRRSSLFDVIITNKITNSEIPPSLPLRKSDETFESLDLLPSQNQRSVALDQEVPTFLKLSNSSTIDCSDLELTIAPPQPHSGLANFSSGIIRVV